MVEEATERVIVNASPERCYQIATDFEVYPEWSTDTKKVDVIETDDQGRGTLVRFWAEAVGRTTQYTLRYNYDEAPRQLTWVLVEGDIESNLDGSYVFEPVEGQTELTYHLAVELRVPMPGFVKRRVEGRILGAALQDLKIKAES